MAQFSLTNNDKRMIFFAAVGFIITLAYVFFLLIPSCGKLHVQIVGLQDAQRLHAVLLAQSKQVQVLQTKKNDCEGIISQYGTKFPPVVDMQAFLKKLSGIAAETGVTITVLTPAEELNQEGVLGFFTRKAIRIEASAGYHQLGVFLNKLEFSDQFIRVEDLGIRSGTTGGHYFRLIVYAYAVT